MTKLSFARLISIIGHPFTFIALLLSLPFWRNHQTSALRVTGLVTVLGMVPLGLFMRHRYRTGKWQTVDASAPKDRPVAYIAILALMLPFGLYFHFVEHSVILVRGTIVLAGTMVVGWILNRWIKGSGHLAFAAFSAVILWRINFAYGLAVALFIPVLAWSRVALSRHTYPEVFAGLALGLLAGAIMLAF